MYKTRIVRVSKQYFVEYKWIGGFWSGMFRSTLWTRWGSNTAYVSLSDAKEVEEHALGSYDLNHGWNEQVVSR